MEDNREQPDRISTKSGYQVLQQGVRLLGDQFETVPDESPEVLSLGVSGVGTDFIEAFNRAIKNIRINLENQNHKIIESNVKQSPKPIILEMHNLEDTTKSYGPPMHDKRKNFRRGA